nr:MAG TPA: SurA N-terminal domain [Caudoviricetes sp.]
MLSNMANSNPLMGRAMQMGKGKSDDELKVIAQNLARQRGMNEKQFSDFLSSFGLNL